MIPHVLLAGEDVDENGNLVKNDANVQAADVVASVEDVMQDYQHSATPGQGKVEFADGYKVGGHQSEIATANWLRDTFGGDIRLLKEAEAESVSTPDYIWRGKNWELKGASSINTADKQLQKAIKQISARPGGVILDITGSIDMDALETQLLRRFQRSRTAGFDLMLLQDGELLRILQYKK